jgi:hypothetical protein
MTIYKLKIMSFFIIFQFFIHTSNLDHISFVIPIEYLHLVPNRTLSQFKTHFTPAQLKYLYFNLIVQLLFSVHYRISVLDE